MTRVTVAQQWESIVNPIVTVIPIVILIIIIVISVVLVNPLLCFHQVGHPFVSTILGHITQASGGLRLPPSGFATDRARPLLKTAHPGDISR
jgi:heme/copper-type cytochrome/quinol oxidase subunit 2